jgi:predicted CXXCH cytochrome family protein
VSTPKGKVAGLAVAFGAALLLTPAFAAEDAAICARCHQDEAALADATGGHAPDLTCLSCHEDRRPGQFGRHHRSVPRCASHHEQTRHPPIRSAHRRPTRNCLVCHDVHGSTNAHLVRPDIRSRRGRLSHVLFDGSAGATPGGFTDPEHPGKGLCEVCHRHTDFYRADARDKPHFTESCILCHDHEAGFRPVITDRNCTICHAAEGALFAKASLHSSRFVCSACHAEASALPGPGHRTTAACADCHENRTHAPPGYAPFACTQCHDPHGTDNAKLLLDVIQTTQGGQQLIHFDNLLGRADGSFASASTPGTGICETCHTTTQFYRADGSGQSHFTFSCLPCHLHADGFAPR